VKVRKRGIIGMQEFKDAGIQGCRNSGVKGLRL
jgi:hypothetical protein